MLTLKQIVFVLFALDAILTAYAVKHYPAKLAEFFAPAKWAMKEFGPATGQVLLKAVFGLGPLALPQADVTLYIIIAGFTALVLWNAWLIYRAGESP